MNVLMFVLSVQYKSSLYEGATHMQSKSSHFNKPMSKYLIGILID